MEADNKLTYVSHINDGRIFVPKHAVFSAKIIHVV